MTYGFIASPPEKNTDTVIATALNGVVYTENKRLHIKNNNTHFVHKFDGSPVGWYARNIKTSDDIYIGAGASPTIEFENLEIKNATHWAKIVAVRQDDQSDEE